MGKPQGPKKWSRPQFSWYGGGMDYRGWGSQESWGGSWKNHRRQYHHKKKSGAYTCCPNPNCHGWAWDDAAYGWCRKCGERILDGEDEEDEEDEQDDLIQADKDVQMEPNGDKQEMEDEEDENIEHSNKILILQEAIAQLWGKKKAKAIFGTIQEKINDQAESEAAKNKSASSDRKETLQTLQKITRERDVIKKKLAAIDKELTDKRDAIKKLEKDRKNFKLRFDEVEERHSKTFDRLTQLRNANSDDDDDGDKEEGEGDDENEDMGGDEGDEPGADGYQTGDQDGDDKGTNDDYNDATYDGPKWQQVPRRGRSVKKDLKQDKKPTRQGSASANEGTGTRKRAAAAASATPTAQRGRIMANAKARVREKTEQQHQAQRQLPTQAGGALPPIDVVPGREGESQAIIAEAHRQAAEKIEALKLAAAAQA